MRTKATAILLLLCGMLFVSSELSAQINYIFSPGTGTRNTGGFSTLSFSTRTGSQWGASYQEFLVNIGFSFSFDGVSYTQARIYHSGVVVLGSGTLSSPTNNSLNNVSVPVLAGIWDDMRITDGLGGQCTSSSIRYKTTGSAPNRVFVVDYDQLGFTTGGNGGRAPVTFQIRLYEGTNKIEYWYDETTGQSSSSCSPWGSISVSTSATIGIGSSNGFVSVTPGATPTTSTTTSANSISFTSTPISANRLYTFCPGGLTGNVSEGGTAKMATGDTLLLGKQVVLSSSQGFQPFNLFNLCATGFTYTVGGARASEYTINPASGTLPASGNMPTLTFAPTGIGVRYATLKVEDNSGAVVRTYVLAGEGIPRIGWVGNIPQGGTAALASGDTLFNGFKQENNTSINYTPITLTVANAPGPPAPIKYKLTDPSGQFKIDRTSENILPGASSSPVITFSPKNNVNFLEATLEVNAEGEVRTYVLRIFSSGAGAKFFSLQQPLIAGSTIFRNVAKCVAQETEVLEIQVQSIGDEPFMLTTKDAFLTNTVIQQGTPPYPLLTDDFGNPIPAPDYFIADVNGNELALPIIVPPGVTQSIYIGFRPVNSGVRRARSFFQTNGENFVGLDVNNGSVLGILNFELVGNGLGSLLTSGVGSKELPKAIVFPSTEVRKTSTLSGEVYNNGDCDLLINANDFRLVSGDVSEFEILSGFTGIGKDAKGNYVLPPGTSATFDVAFTPQRSGSRRASIQLVTNDSSVVIPGVTERGHYYLDVFGVGKVGLEGRNLTLPPAVIDGTTSAGVAILENNSGSLVKITGATIVGTGEIIEDPANVWPTFPVTVAPGKNFELGLSLVPNTGSAPGIRTAVLEVTLDNGDVLSIDVTGLAGSRTLNIVPTELFKNTQVPVGNLRRQFAVIANDGTLPVVVQSVQLSGANMDQYSFTPLARTVIEPGSAEFLEVTFAPTAQGVTAATITVMTNTTNGTPAGTHVITLGGEATATAIEGGAGSAGSTRTPGDDQTAVRPSLGLSDAAVTMADGTALWQSAPNPTSGKAEIRYRLPEKEIVTIKLYNASGQIVKTLVNGEADAGENVLHVDLKGFSSGRYFYTLQTASGVISQALDLVK
ncbi:MAG: choice-of-anchor D domain-containing protein [Ignavibacteriae bacterium]|nr:choice-of-anchor D domain-containing protein [Ignavibacteriota bacterium]MCB9216521.1 choice-of-anchor D domain-containing protein [Ignavibacteria bacterium]